MFSERELDEEIERLEAEIFDLEVEKLLEGPYQDGLYVGMRNKESYNEGLLLCPHRKGEKREQWLSGFENGYFIRSSR